MSLQHSTKNWDYGLGEQEVSGFYANRDACILSSSEKFWRSKQIVFYGTPVHNDQVYDDVLKT